MKKKCLFIAALILASTSCATLEGAGKDIEKAGKAIQDAVEQE